MDPKNSCQCCLIRPLDKSLKKCYRRDHEKEIYSDMLEECFEIQLWASQTQVDGGICEPCIARLRDACDFKRQVQCCQQQLRTIKSMESEIKEQATLQTGVRSDNFLVETKVKIEQEDDVMVVVVESDPEFVDDNVKQTPEYLVEVCKPEKGPEPSKATIVHRTIDASKRLHRTRDTRRKDPPKDVDVKKKAPKSPQKSLLKNLLNVPILDAASVQRTQAERPNIRTNGQGDTEEKKTRPRPKVSTPYKNYDKKTFEEALEAVRTKTMSCAKASLHYHVPKSSIAAKLALDRKNSGLDKVRPKPTKSISEKMPKRVYSKTSADTVRTHEANVRTLIQHSNCTPFLTRTIAGIECCYCEAKLLNLANLRKHMQLAHTSDQYYATKNRSRDLTCKIDITDLKCKLCEQDFDLLSSLKEHLIKEHDVEFLPEAKSYIFEFKLSENGENSHCALCSFSFEAFRALLIHMNEHYRNFLCKECDMGFVNEKKLMSHQRIHEIGTFKCSFCAKVFPTLVKQTYHEKNAHSVNAARSKSKKCPLCEKRFTCYAVRNRHLLEDHNSTAGAFKCHLCEKIYTMKEKLSSHFRSVHLMERNYKCTKCDKDFFAKYKLKLHMIRHNGERIHECTVCNKAYARKTTLKDHMRIHENDRKYKCDLCPKTFVHKSSQKDHMMCAHNAVPEKKRPAPKA